MNVDSDKPRYIECIYEAPITFDLEELGVDFDKIDDYYIKYGTLYITYKDGTRAQHDGDIGEPDYKWAVSESILTEDWDFVEGLN
jgi:hypothetical protein|tara:strand:+ start:120 stop:374 length:255 start_codon:yes stop_codon:yes gene_type:complete